MSDTRKVGKYEILEELGRGGFATVYKARDLELERLVALKILHPFWQQDNVFAQRFHREARKAAILHHPNIITIYEAGDIESQPYIAMAYIPGQTLQTLLETEQKLPIQKALTILEQVAKALDYAHSQGVIHRDIKPAPANLMVQEIDNRIHIFLLDFGLLKMTESSLALTSVGTLLGSPEYMAPEQAVPEKIDLVGPPADRYSLGIVAYQMLTGRVPFPGNSPGTLKAHEHDPVPPPQTLRSDLPEAAATALLKMLAKAPADRYLSATLFVKELERAWQNERQLAPLYDQLQELMKNKAWGDVLAVGARIQVVDPDYRDVSQLLETARKRLNRRRLVIAGSLTSTFLIALLGAVFFIFIYPTIPCNSQVITYVTQGENGRQLWLVDNKDNKNLLMDRVADVMVLAVSQDRCYLALAVSNGGTLARDFNEFPRFIGSYDIIESSEEGNLYTNSGGSRQPVSLFIVSDDGRQITEVLTDVFLVDAMFTSDGNLFTAVIEENDDLFSISYLLRNADGSLQSVLYRTEEKELPSVANPSEVEEIIPEEEAVEEPMEEPAVEVQATEAP